MNKKFKKQAIMLLSIAAFSFSMIAATGIDDEKPKLPAEILDLKNWKVNVPEGIKTPLRSDEYKQPSLNTYSHENWFHSNTAGDGVIFKAHTGGTTTKGSGYPRSELREMIENGTKNASWSSSEGEHTLFVELSITHLPEVRSHIVVAQIHDAEDDVIVYRLENKKLFMKLDDVEGPTIDENYQLGTKFTLMFKVKNNETQCYYNGKLKYTYKKAFVNSFFKTGAYVQSSCQGKRKVEGESCDAYGEMEIYKVWVKHKI